jgi:hypothetical protein
MLHILRLTLLGFLAKRWMQLERDFVKDGSWNVFAFIIDEIDFDVPISHGKSFNWWLVGTVDDR